MLTGEGVLYHHRHVRRVGPDAVKHKIHAAESRDAVDQLDAAKLFSVQKRKLFLIELVVIPYEVVRSEKESSGAASWIANNAGAARTVGRLRLHYIDNCADERTRSEVLAGA